MRRDLSILDRDMFASLGRILQEGFAHGFDCSIIQGGLLSTGTPQTVYAQSVTQNYVIGSVMQMKDGRKFQYSKAGTLALGIGLMHQGPVVVSNYVLQVQTGYGWAANASSGTVLITTGATPAVDAWKDGWLCVSSGTGAGQFHKIKSNTSHATLPMVTLDEPLLTAFPVTADVSIIPNNCKGTIVVPTTGLTQRPVGVPLLVVDIGYYYWSQFAGPAPLLVDTAETIVIGDPCGHPAACAVAGACGLNVTLKGGYGRVLVVAPAAEYAIVDLEISR